MPPSMFEALRVIEMACVDGGWLSIQCLEPNFHEIFLKKLGLQQDPEFQRQFDQEAWPVLSARLAGVFA